MKCPRQRRLAGDAFSIRNSGMSSTAVNLIIQLFSGAAGSGLLAKFLSSLNLGPMANLITGAVGGIAGAHVLGSFLGSGAAASAAGSDLSSILTQIVGGGVGGPILTTVVALLRNARAGGRTA
jgi:hypothetical protein